MLSSGVNIDSKLSFNRHISSTCSKVNKQLSVVKRFKHLVSDHIKRRLYMYNAFILPAFNNITVVMFGTFVTSVVMTNWNNSISRL